jgi:hypothetical protein
MVAALSCQPGMFGTTVIFHSMIEFKAHSVDL